MGVVINNSPIIYSEEGARYYLYGHISNIQNRYNNLKTQILSQTYIDNRRKQNILNLKKKIAQINLLYQSYTPQQIEDLLLKSATNNLDNSFTQSLETVASTSSAWLTTHFDKLNQNIHRGKFVQGLNVLYSLFNSQGQSIDNNSFNILYDRIYTTLTNQGSYGGLKETGNILGDIGSVAAAQKANDVLNTLLDQFVSQNKNVGLSIMETGAQKKPGTNQTRTSDMVAIFYDKNTGSLLTSINFSNKFNAKYKKNSKSTGGAVKLATRSVSSFLNEVNSSYKKSYDYALSNFISYHQADDATHFERTDFIRDYPAEWNVLRRAIGAEMVYNLLAKRKNTEQINDDIDIYIYGDKLFLDDSILKSKTKSKQFNLAQISLNKRKALLRSGSLQSRPTEAVIAGRENYVYNKIIKTTNISYSQTINFV